LGPGVGSSRRRLRAQKLHANSYRLSFGFIGGDNTSLPDRSGSLANGARRANALREIAVFAGDHAMTIARRQFLQLAGAGLLAVAPRASTH
jgi:hypothetical protein